MSNAESGFPGPKKTESIDLVVNGERTTAPAGCTLAMLVDRMNIPRDRVAVELNRQIIRRPAWEGTLVEAGANVEIVHFVGGG
jgi:thiamine biosynthesis protein ThiS